MYKILEIFTYHTGYRGGVATIIDNYMDEVDYFAQNNCELIHLNIDSAMNTGHAKIDNFAYIFSQRRAVKKFLDKNYIDLVHIHTSREFLFLKDVLLAKLICKKYHIPIVMTIHVGSIDTVYNRIGLFKKQSIRILNTYVDKVIFLSKVMQQNYIDLGLLKKKTSVLYNFYRFAPYPVDQLKCKNKETLKMLYVGAIHREKGIIELLQAVSEMPNLNFHLNICGQLTDKSIKDDVDNMKRILGEKVSFLGYVIGKDKTRIFYESDILILPSYHEGLPLVIMEALGAGCAIMTTAVGAIPEILNDDNCLWLDIASVKSIKNQLKNLTYEKLNNMKQANKKLGLTFSLEEHINILSRIYHNVINK